MIGVGRTLLTKVTYFLARHERKLQKNGRGEQI
jgi:hypothetical protein